MGKQSILRVVGLTFRPGYPANVNRLAKMMEADAADEILSAEEWGEQQAAALPGIPVLLVHQADNPVDANAVQVIVPRLGRQGWVGFVPKDLAAKWAPMLDAGRVFEAAATSCPIDPLHEDRPSVEILVRVHDGDCAKADGLVCTCSREARRAGGWSAPVVHQYPDNPYDDC